MLGSYLAIAIQNMQLQQDDEDEADGTPGAAASVPSGPTRELIFYRGEEVVMLDGEYLIRSDLELVERE